MLQSIRESIQGWFAWVIVSFLVVLFALWGIGSYLGGGSVAIKASVNNRDITEREFENDYHKFREQLRQRLGDSYRADLLDDKLLRKDALASMIRSELIYQQALDLGMRTSDEVLRDLIKNSRIFQMDGRFSNDAYEDNARRMGLTTDGYELKMRQLLVSDQLSRSIVVSEITTQAELEDGIRLSDQHRKMSYLILPAANYFAAAEIKPEEIEDYYKANKQSFMSRDRVKLEYLELDIDNIAKTVKVDGVVVSTGKVADQDKKDMEEEYRKEEAGRLFYEYAEKLGNITYEDPDSLEPAAEALGLKVQKSDWIEREGGKSALEDGRIIAAAFSEDVLMEHHNSEVLELGPEHVLVLRVVEHEEPQVRPFEQVRGDIESILKRSVASRMAEQKGKEIMAKLREGGSLAKTASEYKARYNQTVETGRDSDKVPEEILQTLFRMPRPEGQALVYDETALASGDYAVIALEQVMDGSDAGLTDEDKARLKLSMEGMLGQSTFDHMVENMRDRSNVVITEEKK